MIKNDYRRDMILLRPLEDGISGFCRLEARVSRGSITYNIRAQRGFGGRLIAVLAGVHNGRWQAAAGGEIRADALGQAGYYWEFDPRAINSLALENYALIGVAVDGPDARLLLAGKQDKGCMVDWQAAERAVHELLAPMDSGAAHAEKMGGTDAADAGSDVRSAMNTPAATAAAGDAQPCCRSPQPQAESDSAADAGAPARERASGGGEVADDNCAQEGGSADMAAAEGQAADASEHCRRSEGAQANAHAHPAPHSTSCGMRFEICGDGGVQDRSRLIRVLGASIAGEKDCELDDDALERAIAQALRGVMGRLGLDGDDSAAPQASAPDAASASRDSATPQSGAASEESATPQSGAALEESATPQTSAASEESATPQTSAASNDVPYISPNAADSESDEMRIVAALLEEERERESDGDGAALQSMCDEPKAAVLQGGDGREFAAPGAHLRDANAQSADGGTAAPSGVAGPNDVSARSAAAATGDAAEPWLLEGLCAQERTWPDCCAELKPLFCGAVRACPLDEPGFVFVRAPMAGGGSCAVGVKCEDGLPSEVMYLIPGNRAAVPPAGLEGYVWREGEGGGFWVARQDAYTGTMLFDQ